MRDSNPSPDLVIANIDVDCQIDECQASNDDDIIEEPWVYVKGYN